MERAYVESCAVATAAKQTMPRAMAIFAATIVPSAVPPRAPWSAEGEGLAVGKVGASL